jgi:hypothetical protein
MGSLRRVPISPLLRDTKHKSDGRASAHNDGISFGALGHAHLAVPAQAVFIGEGARAALPANHLGRGHRAMGDKIQIIR